MNNTFIKISTFFDLVRRRHITLKKLINMAKVRLSLLLKSHEVWGMPYSISIEPTNFCNLQCPLCPVGKNTLGRKKGFMDLESYKRLIDETSPYLFNLLLSVWGEPMLHKDIYGMISYAKKKKIKVTVMTNGHFFDTEEAVQRLVDSKLDNLLLALDAVDQETLAKYRKNGNYQKIVDGIKSIVKEKKRQNSRYPRLELQFVVMKHNQHQIKDIKKLARQLQVDTFVLKTTIVNTKEEAEQFQPDDISLRRNRREVKNGCPSLWTDATVYWDGSVVPCCIDYKSEHLFGNIENEDLKHIWNNKKFMRFRGQVLKNKKALNLCSSCPGGDDNFDIERVSIK